MPDNAYRLTTMLVDFNLIRKRPPEEFLDKLVPALTAQTGNFKYFELRNTIDSFAKLVIDPGAEVLSGYLDVLKSSPGEIKQPDTTLIILRAVAALDVFTSHEETSQIADHIFNVIGHPETFFEKTKGEDKLAFNMAAQWFGRTDLMLSGAKLPDLSEKETRLMESFRKIGASVTDSTEGSQNVIEIDSKYIADFNEESMYQSGMALFEAALFARDVPNGRMVKIHPLDALALDIENGTDKLAAALWPHFTAAAPGVYTTDIQDNDLTLSTLVKHLEMAPAI